MINRRDIHSTNEIGHFLSELIAQLNLPKVVELKALKILDEAEGMGLKDFQNPRGQASAALYIAVILTGNRITQTKIAEISRVSESTIQRKYLKLARQLRIKKSI